MLYVSGRKAVKIHVIYNYNYRIINLILFPRESGGAIREDFPDLQTMSDLEIVKETINKLLAAAGYKLTDAREVTPACWRHVFVRDEALVLFSMQANGHGISQIKISVDFRVKQLYLAYLTLDKNNPDQPPIVIDTLETDKMDTGTDFDTLLAVVKKFVQNAKFSLVHSSGKNSSCLNDYFVYNFTPTR